MRSSHLIRAVLAVVVVGFLIYYVEPQSMLDAAAGADWRWIAGATLLLPLNLALEGTVWIYLARRVDPELSIADGFGALLAGYALGFFTPARAGDFAGRAFYVRHADKWEIAAVVAAQRLLDGAVIITVGACALFAFIATHQPEPTALWRGLGAVGGLFGLILLAAGLLPAATLHMAHRVIPFDAVLQRLVFLGRLSSGDGALILALNLARFAVYGTQFVFLIRALVPAADLSVAYIGVAVIFFGKVFMPPVTLMDLGIREGVAVFVLGRTGLPEAAVLNASILLFAINMLVPSALGVRYVLRMRMPWQEGGDAEYQSERST